MKAFTPQLDADWQEVLLQAPNATLMHQRSYLAYHGNRFQDVSVLIYAKNRPVAVFAAHKEGKEVYSHKGLSYAGMIHRRCSFHQELRLYRMLLRYYQQCGFEHLTIKATPTVYNSEAGESLSYLMHLAGAQTVQMELSQAVTLPLSVKHKGRKATIRQAQQAGLEIKAVDDVGTFWDSLLVPNLEARYQKQPTHTKEEMRYLKSHHPGNIYQFLVFEKEQALAGATVYQTETCLHTQYLASNARGRVLHALDLLIHHLGTKVAQGKNYLDFGHSNEAAGRRINHSLFRWKQSFGTRSFPMVQYRVPATAWKRLDTVFIDKS